MKKVTMWATLLAMIAGIGMGCTFLFVPLAGLFFGLVMISPLIVTILMSDLLVGTATQVILLVSTIGYLTNLIHTLYFNSTQDSFLPFVYPIPIMIVLWFIAGFLSLTRAEIEIRHIKNKTKPGR